jgi:cytochrome b561
MLCQNCGTEIAEKALVCFRCGQATVAPLRKPAPPPSRWRSAAAFLALVLLALAALFLGLAGTIDVPMEVRYGVIVVALALLVWRVVARRR